MATEKRQALRKIVRIKTELTLPDSNPIFVNTVDIGQYGMCIIKLPLQLITLQKVRVNFEIVLNGRIQAVGIDARVSYCVFTDDDGFKAGLQFLNLESAEAALIAQYVGE